MIPAFLDARRDLIANLISRDVKARYKQSILGYAWAFLFPLATALIYSLVGQKIMRANVDGLPFPVFSYFGLLYWNLFSAGVTAATESLVAHLSLITKVYFPREVFPIAAVLSKLVDFGFGLAGMVLLLLWYRTGLSLAGLPVLVLSAAILLLYGAGLGLLLSCANLFYRDIRHVVGIFLSLGSFLVPNIYPVTLVPRPWQSAYLLDPPAVAIEAARRACFPSTGSLGAIDPAQGHQTSLFTYLAAAAAFSLVVFLIGYSVFKRNEYRFAEFI